MRKEPVMLYNSENKLHHSHLNESESEIKMRHTSVERIIVQISISFNFLC